MDYAATFFDYQDLAGVPIQTEPRGTRFPATVTLENLHVIAAALRAFGLWSILQISFCSVLTVPTWPAQLLVSFAIASLAGLYWAKHNVFDDGHAAWQLRYTAVLKVIAAVDILFICAAYGGHENVYLAALDISCCDVAIFAMALLLNLVYRQGLRHVIRTRRLACSLAVIGEPHAMRGFIGYMRNHHPSARIMAAFLPEALDGAAELDGVPVLGAVPQLLNFHKHHPSCHVILVSPEYMDRLKSALCMQPLHFSALSPRFDFSQAKTDISAAGVPGVELTPILNPPLHKIDQALKSIFDRCAALLGLLLMAPVLLVCVAGIKLTSPGPVLYKQKRIGYRNDIFHVYKFRSMHLLDCDKITLTQRNDSRVFAFGRLMRRLSLDELPQLINVIRGDMSLVGPRPHMREARAGDALYYEVVPDYAARHRVKPGITGWAQINGWRGPTETDHAIRARVEHDLYYIENWSFWLDLKILFRTVAGGFSGHNAV